MSIFYQFYVRLPLRNLYALGLTLPTPLTMLKDYRIRGTSLIIVGDIFERCLFDDCVDVRVNVWDILRMPSAFHESQGVNKVDPALE